MRAEPRNVSMYPKHWQIVDAEAERMQEKISATLRRIVIEWYQLKNLEKTQQIHHGVVSRA